MDLTVPVFKLVLPKDTLLKSLILIIDELKSQSNGREESAMKST